MLLIIAYLLNDYKHIEEKGRWLNMIDVLTKVKCPCYENDIEVNCNEYIAGSTSSEKDMGIDIQWIIESEPMYCPNCDSRIILVGTVGIYPEDTVEFVDVGFKKTDINI